MVPPVEEAGYCFILLIVSHRTDPFREPTFPPAAPTAVLLTPGVTALAVVVVLRLAAALSVAYTLPPPAVCGATVMACMDLVPALDVEDELEEVGLHQ